MESLILDLHYIEAVKFSSFKLKYGITSPIYINLCLIVSHPSFLSYMAVAPPTLPSPTSPSTLSTDTVLPIDLILFVTRSLSMLMLQKEVKDHSTTRTIEDVNYPGQICLIVEDLITNSASVLDTATPLCIEGLEVRDAVIAIDRENGGRENLMEKRIQLHTLFMLVEVLVKSRRLWGEMLA